jgi:hypothetical protein
MALLVIRGADFDLVPFLPQSSHVLLICPGLNAQRHLAHFKSIYDEFKAVVEECADLGVTCCN